MIVIVSFAGDPHANVIEKALSEFSFNDYIRLDLEAWRENLSLVVGEGSWTIHDHRFNRTICAADCQTVWWRRSGMQLSPNAAVSYEQVDSTESYWAVRWLIESIDVNRFPFGHPHKLRRAENKLRQLEVAKQLGFTCPRTCLSNSRDVLTRFTSQHEWVVIKPLYVSVSTNSGGEEISFKSVPIIGEDLSVRLSNRETETFLFCQERVNKVSDVRVLFFPDGSHFACEIHTAALPPNEVDWRPDTMTFRHTSFQLESRLQQQCQAYLNKFELSSGSFDFGVTREGEYVFFECNPNGQWLWMELKTSEALGRRFARILLDHHTGSLQNSSRGFGS